jgi:hypothetical protein
MVVIAISDCVHQVFVLLKEKPNNIKTPVIYNGWFIMFFVFIYLCILVLNTISMSDDVGVVEQ